MKRADKVWLGLMDFGNRMGCHQMESRSFFFRGYQFPVCARCTGVILGEFITLFLIIVNLKINLMQAIVLLLIMGLDWFLQYVKIAESNNIRRLYTGILGGIGLTFIYYHIVINIFILLLTYYN